MNEGILTSCGGGSLTIVGTGIHVGHLTTEARGWISHADVVLYCVADAATERLICKLNPISESLYPYYDENKVRSDTYEQMVERTLYYVRKGKNVCVAYYGHPGIFVNPAHRSLKIAREEGYKAIMLPAVSSIDCLFCDLGVDPSSGCQILEATDLMLRQRYVDSASHVIIMQVSALGELDYHFNGYDQKHLPSLGLFLSKTYSEDHKIKAYHAAQFPVVESTILDMKISDLKDTLTAGISTIYIPPYRCLPVHLSMLEQYGLRHLLDDKELLPLNTSDTGLLLTRED